jgi:hypothetical protein
MFDVQTVAPLFPQPKSAWFLPRIAYPVVRQTAVESKPLFHPEVLRQQVRLFKDHRHLDARDAALLQRRAPAGL